MPCPKTKVFYNPQNQSVSSGSIPITCKRRFFLLICDYFPQAFGYHISVCFHLSQCRHCKDGFARLASISSMLSVFADIQGRAFWAYFSKSELFSDHRTLFCPLFLLGRFNCLRISIIV